MLSLYLDAGANWGNTLRLANDLFPKQNWLTVAFEASPMIQPFVEDYVDFLNAPPGERPDAPTVCLPRSGSTPHLRRYAPSLGCKSKSDEAMRACVMAALAPRLAALKPDPSLNSSDVVDKRLAEAGMGILRRGLAKNH